MNESWDGFFDPKLVCVVGASANPSRIGGRLVRYSIESAFAGRIIPVNPNHRTIFDLPAVPSLTKVDEPPDWVVVAVPSEQVPDVVTQAGEVGARNVLVVAAGFAETGEPGRRRQQELAAIAQRYGMRLLGPNSNGFMNVATGAFFAFTPVLDSARPALGDLGIVTQSAALGTYLLNYCRTTGLGVRHWIHTGNEASTTLLEVAGALAARGQVRAIALCLEVLRDPLSLYPTLRMLASAGVAVGVLQAGVSPAGKRASEAHTAALIGSESSLLADLFADGGAFPARSIGELASFLQAAVNFAELPSPPRIGVVTTSGGVGVLAADAFAADRLPMPTLSAGLQQRIRSSAPFSHPANPVDTTAQVINQPEAFQRVLDDCLDSGELDLVAVFVAHGLAGPGDRTLGQVMNAAERRGDRGPALAAVGILSPDAAHAAQSKGIAVFPEPAVLSSALRAYLDAVERRKEFLSRPQAAPQPQVEQPASVSSVLPAAGSVPRLDEWTAKQLLRSLGAPVVDGQLVESAESAEAAAGRLGYPVVLKVSSVALAHKAAAGGIRLHLWTRKAVRDAYAALAAVARRLSDPSARLLLERQVVGDELFVACTRHPTLGLLVGIGPGGSGVEQAGGVRWHWSPVTASAVLGSGTVAVEKVGALADILTALQRLAAQPRVQTVETNPVIVTSDGTAVVADALVELEEAVR